MNFVNVNLNSPVLFYKEEKQSKDIAIMEWIIWVRIVEEKNFPWRKSINTIVHVEQRIPFYGIYYFIAVWHNLGLAIIFPNIYIILYFNTTTFNHQSF